MSVKVLTSLLESCPDAPESHIDGVFVKINKSWVNGAVLWLEVLA